MDTMVWAFMNSIVAVWACKITMVVLLVALIAYAFSKEGRDERGRAIIGTASIWGVVALFVAGNAFSHFTNTILENGAIVFTNAYSLVALAFLVPLWIAILVLRKVR